jgi:hypothetical protein
MRLGEDLAWYFPRLKILIYHSTIAIWESGVLVNLGTGGLSYQYCLILRFSTELMSHKTIPLFGFGPGCGNDKEIMCLPQTEQASNANQPPILAHIDPSSPDCAGGVMICSVGPR